MPAAAVSVIIPTFNRASLIGQTLQSVADQTFADFECIVVDDGSTDDTRRVVEEFAARDGRFRYFWQENASAAAARQRGLTMAAGRYVAFLDSDDRWPPDKLRRQVAMLDADAGAVVAYGEGLMFHGEDPTVGRIYQGERPRPSGDVFDVLVTWPFILSPGSALIRTQALGEVGGLDLTLPSAEDWDMWLALSKRGRFLHDPEVALYYRTHVGNKSSNVLRSYLCADRVARRHLAPLPWRRRRRLYAKARDYFRWGYGERLRLLAHRLTNEGDWPQARRVWLALTRLDAGLLRREPAAAVNVLWALAPSGAAVAARGWLRRLKARLRPAPNGSK